MSNDFVTIGGVEYPVIKTPRGDILNVHVIREDAKICPHCGLENLEKTLINESAEYGTFKNVRCLSCLYRFLELKGV